MRREPGRRLRGPTAEGDGGRARGQGGGEVPGVVVPGAAGSVAGGIIVESAGGIAGGAAGSVAGSVVGAGIVLEAGASGDAGGFELPHPAETAARAQISGKAIRFMSISSAISGFAVSGRRGRGTVVARPDPQSVRADNDFAPPHRPVQRGEAGSANATR
jgi:hypothetical protein